DIPIEQTEIDGHGAFSFQAVRAASARPDAMVCTTTWLRLNQRVRVARPSASRTSPARTSSRRIGSAKSLSSLVKKLQTAPIPVATSLPAFASGKRLGNGCQVRTPLTTFHTPPPPAGPAVLVP